MRDIASRDASGTWIVAPTPMFIHAERMTTDTYENYLRDLGHLLRQSAVDAVDTARRDRDDAFAQGRGVAYYEVVSLMRNQAVAFGLDLAALSLDGVDPERDLI